MIPLKMSEQKLTWLDQIGKRPGMYVGDLSIHGLKNMLGYFFDDILENATNRVELNLDFNVNNYIALTVSKIDTSLFVKTLDNLITGNNLVAFGLPVIIALSEQAEIRFSNKGSLFSLSSRNGNYNCSKTPYSENIDFIKIEYKIDQSVFKLTELSYEVFNQFLRKYAFLNTCLKIISNDNRTKIRQTNLFDYPNGLSHQLDFKIGEQLYGQSFFRLDLSVKIDEYHYQICISYQDIWLGQAHVMTYANYDELIYGGSLEIGVVDGILLAVKLLADSRKISIDRRKIREQLILLAVIKGKNFNFYGSTKTKLNMPKVRKAVKEFVSDKILKYLAENETIEEQLLSKLTKHE
jgi:DNA gyrase subunit B